MRLSCPNCGAQYEVPVEVIPEAGRDVQCSNCGHTWFQIHPDQDAEMAADLGRSMPDEGWTPEDAAHAHDAPQGTDTPHDAAAVPPDDQDRAEDPVTDHASAEIQPPEPEFEAPEYGDAGFEDPDKDLADAPVSDTDHPDQDHEDPHAEHPHRRERRAIDPDVADLLRQEAEHEARIRAAEQEDTFASQPDLGLEDPAAPSASLQAQEARARMRRMRGLPDDAPDDSADSAEIVPDPDLHHSRRELLPDIEEINSTLRAADDRGSSTVNTRGMTAKYKRRVGFRLGFGFTMLFASMVILAYVYNHEIIAAWPKGEPYVIAFMEKMNMLRVWLDTRVSDAMLWMNTMAASAGGNVE